MPFATDSAVEAGGCGSAIGLPAWDGSGEALVEGLEVLHHRVDLGHAEHLPAGHRGVRHAGQDDPLEVEVKLITTKASIIFAEDTYTLPFAVIFGKLKRAKIYYDSRELFGYLAGLKYKKLKQLFWKWTEKFFIRKVDYVIVTGPMDGDFLKKDYGLLKNIIY